MPEQIKDKDGRQIDKGDVVFTKIRGGRREGEVAKIVKDETEAKPEGVKNPPKVLFEDQHGHHVSHNPETLRVTEKE